MSKSKKTRYNKIQVEKRNTQNSSSRGKTPAEIVKRHLRNKSDKITGDDIKDVKIDLSIPKDKAHKTLALKPRKERPKDADTDHTVFKPWDVIGG